MLLCNITMTYLVHVKGNDTRFSNNTRAVLGIALKNGKALWSKEKAGERARVKK